MHGKWSKSDIPTITEIVLCMHGVCNNMVQPIHRNVEISWINYQSILQMHSKQFHRQQSD